METPAAPARHWHSPGWPEVATALIVYILLLVPLLLWMLQLPPEQAVLRGIAGMTVNGVAGIAALLAAFALRIRRLRVFGFKATSSRWLMACAAIGLFAFGASFIVEYVYFLFVTEPNTQADFQVVAKRGPLMLAMLLFTGAILTPLGEEFVFRGVIANAFNRYGAWVSVIGSALIFAAMHGPSVIFFDALLVGLLTGVVFRKSGSIWPPVAVHIVYNGLHLLYYSIA